jgi:hypothetical protein
VSSRRDQAVLPPIRSRAGHSVRAVAREGSYGGLERTGGGTELGLGVGARRTG